MSLVKVINKIGLGKRLTFLMIIISLVSSVTISFIAYYKSSDSLMNNSKLQQTSLGALTKERIENVFNNTFLLSKKLLRDRLIEGLIIAFEGNFYGAGFFPGEDVVIDNSGYKELVDKYKGRPEDIAKVYNLANIALATLDGQIIYSTNLETKSELLGKSITDGVLSKTSLKECFEKAISSDSRDQLFFSGYFINPITNQVNAFLCGKQFAEFDYLADGISAGDALGVVLSQVDINAINKITTSKEGMGDTGQVYIVSSEGELRSQFFDKKGRFSVVDAIQNHKKVESKSISLALDGKSGTIIAKNPAGNEVMSIYSPINVFGHDWAILVEKEMSEILMPVREMLVHIAIALTLVLLVIVVVSLYLSGLITKPLIEAGSLLKDIVNSIGRNSREMTTSSQKLSGGSNKIASSTQETAATLDELTAIVQKNLESVNTTTNTTATCENSAQKGRSQVHNMVAAVKDIEKTNEEVITTLTGISEKMNEFVNVVGEISEKTQSIDDIVFQTKLLSFNASVEAARAGEHGKGFSIVAEEIGSLATESGKASHEITTIINDSIDKVRSVVEDTNKKVEYIKELGSQKINAGLRTAQECDTSLDEILKAVKEVSFEVSSIATSSQEQSSGIKEVSNSIVMLDEAAHETNTLSGSSLDIANRLKSSSESLQKVASNIEDLIYGVEDKSIKTVNSSNDTKSLKNVFSLKGFKKD